MPELPEVETVRTELSTLLSGEPVITRVQLMRANIRFVIPPELPARLTGQRLLAIRRRAKYLLFDTPGATLLNHLGMTGSWRFLEVGQEDKHDHCYLEFADGRRMAFRDPRRFGVLDLIEPGKDVEHKLLRALGPEPLDEILFTPEALFAISRKRRIPIKALIMDQRIVVGIGNIYASEVLHRAGVRPGRQAGRLTKDEAARIVAFSREILREAILQGGSSIRDYRQASGAEGSFQESHLVYGREDEVCRACGEKIKAKVIGGRSTFWCTHCQR